MEFTMPGDTQAPAAPTGLTAVAGTGKAVSLSWNANTEEDLAEYAVYRALTDNFAGATKIAEVTGTRFVDVDVELEETYYYWITAIDRTGNESLPSASVTATPGVVGSGQIDPVLFDIVPSSSPAPSSGNLEDLWDMDPNTGCTFPSAPITITFRYPVYQGSDLVELHLGGASQGYVQMRQRDTGQWVNVLGSPASPLQFSQGWNRVPFAGGKLYFGREYRLVLLDNVRINELRFERVTVADLILAGKLRLTGDMAIESADGKSKITSTFWEHRGPNDELLFHLEGGNAFFGGQLAAKSVKTENIVDGAISNLVVQKFNTEISKRVTVPVSDSYDTMPDMTFQYQVTRPCRLFIMVSAPVYGLFRYYVIRQLGLFYEIWAHPQTRFIVNGQVIDEDPTPPKSLDFPSIVSPGTYMHELVFTENDSFPQTVTGRLEWRVAAGINYPGLTENDEIWISNRRRGYSILELAK